MQDFTRFNPTFLALGAPFSALGDTRNDRDYAQKSDLDSAFAQGELSVTDQLRITAGARFNHEKKSGRRTLAIVKGPLSTAPLPVVTAVFRALNIEAHSVSGKLSEDSFNPMVNVQYDATDDLMLYASFARGTKAGGFDIRSNSLPTSTTVAKPGAFMFEDESADNFEAGLKYKGRNIAFNLSLYRTKYKDPAGQHLRRHAQFQRPQRRRRDDTGGRGRFSRRHRRRADDQRRGRLPRLQIHQLHRRSVLLFAGAGAERLLRLFGQAQRAQPQMVGQFERRLYDAGDERHQGRILTSTPTSPPPILPRRTSIRAPIRMGM